MPKFTVNAEPQISEPIEVEINGHAYTVGKISRRVLREIDAIQAGIKDAGGLGSAESVFRPIELLLGPEAKEDIDTLDLFEAGRIFEWIAGQYVRRGLEIIQPAPAVPVAEEKPAAE